MRFYSLLVVQCFFCLAPMLYAGTPPIASLDEVAWESGQPREMVALTSPGVTQQKGDFSFAIWVKLKGKGNNYPSLAANKRWEDGDVVDLLSTSNMGVTLTSGTRRGWVLAAQPNGSWLWNVGNGKSRLDYMPTANRQPILDDQWHLLAFSVDSKRKEARLFYDGLNVAIYSINGFENLATDQHPSAGEGGIEESSISGLLANASYWNRTLSDEEMFFLYKERYPDAQQPELPERVGDLKVLSWNIWHGARHPGIEQGIGQAVEVIKQSGADIITMQETYGSGPTIADRLGYYFYLRSSNISVLSRYPLKDTHDLYEPFRLGGVTVELSPTQRVNVFSLWIHYLPAWRRDAAADGATADSLIEGEWTTRASEMRDILKQLKPFIEQSDEVPLIVGGDFNSPSTLDWTDETATWHNGLAVDWPVSRQMLDAGFTDTYRHIHGDSAQHQPHEQWTSDARRLTYRIDYIYTLGKSIRPISSRMMNTYNGKWPSDHPAVLSTLRLESPLLKVISYNVLEGFRGGKSDRFPPGKVRQELVTAWLAKQTPDIVGFQELNEYTQHRLRSESQSWGHSHAATLKEDGYIVGLTSNRPIEVIERLRKDMHHGMLHCRTAGIDCFIVHLSPFRYRHRQEEMRLILDRVKQSRDNGRPVLVMGDFNASSPADRVDYDGNEALLARLRASDVRHDHVENLNEGQIDYSVMQMLIDTDMVDLYAKHRDGSHLGQRRIDFIFASPDIAGGSTSAQWFVSEAHRKMSDHYPVSASIALPQE